MQTTPRLNWQIILWIIGRGARCYHLMTSICPACERRLQITRKVWTCSVMRCFCALWRKVFGVVPPLFPVDYCLGEAVMESPEVLATTRAKPLRKNVSHGRQDFADTTTWQKLLFCCMPEESKQNHGAQRLLRQVAKTFLTKPSAKNRRLCQMAKHIGNR